MRIAAKILFFILSFTALGFCVAFVMEELISRSENRSAEVAVEQAELPKEGALGRVLEMGNETEDAVDWQAALAQEALAEIDFTDRILGESESSGALMLEVALAELEIPVLEEYFMELMARDLDDYRAVAYAGRVLREISSRNPQLGVTLLYAMSPAEKEKLVPSLAGGWVANDPETAFGWIESAWIDGEGQFIDRALQNDLYIHAMDTLMSTVKDYDYAALVLDGIVDPDLREALVDLVARSVVRDGPENALARIGAVDGELFDTSVMDAIAEEWAERDGVGAMTWTLDNQNEISRNGVRSIAKQLVLDNRGESLAAFHGELVDVPKRDTVAAEAARLTARRDPIRSADWVLAINRPVAKRDAVYGALYEIGYDDLGQSVDYIEYVYTPSEPDRMPVLYSTLKDWMEVDRDSVVEYLISSRSQLSDELSEDILLAN